MRTINALVIHCSATPPGMDIGVDEIRRWHTDPHPRGNGWSAIGYHAVIRRDGTLDAGRPEARKGAHVRARNADSLGVCLVGGVDARGRPENTFTPPQFDRLERAIADIRDRHGDIDIIGHRDIDPGKACPAFDVEDWLIAAAAKELLGVGADYVRSRRARQVERDIARARAEAEIEMEKRRAQMKADYDVEALRQQRHSCRDEYLVLLWSPPDLIAFAPVAALTVQTPFDGNVSDADIHAALTNAWSGLVLDRHRRRHVWAEVDVGKDAQGIRSGGATAA